MSEALCQCGHAEDAHSGGTGDCAGFMHPCRCKRFAPTPPPTREPIRLTGEAEAAYIKWLDRPNPQPEEYGSRLAFLAGFRAARLAGGPTLADARTPESEDD